MVNVMENTSTVNILFICSRNQWRGPTGEKVWGRVAGVSTRSAGTSGSARRRLTSADIQWADLILVMEEKHKSMIRAGFRDEITNKALHVLDIADDFQYMDPELVELIQETTGPLIRNATPQG